jgi:adenine/guanine phosphoribosyltransferase-like PRPP-binding protein
MHGIPAVCGEPICVFQNTEALKQHPGYRLAKSGDAAAAAQLVADLAPPLVDRLRHLGTDVIIVAPHAQEATGENAIPQTLASFLARQLGARDDTSIVQRNRVFHTGADAMQRLISPSEYFGTVASGASYVVADDVSTLGGTLADLGSYITNNGGAVVGCVVLVYAARSGRVIPAVATLGKLERRFGGEVRDIFGIEIPALTYEESQYLLGFRSVDEIRNRAAAAKQTRAERIRSKGVR